MHFTTAMATIALVMELYLNNHAHPYVTHINTEDKMITITRENAEQAVIPEIRRIYKDDADNLAIDKSKTKEYPFGWVVVIFPKEYMETGIPDLGIFGIGFFIVKKDGSVDHIPNSVSPGIAIDWYMRTWKANHGNDQSK